jgi:predicted RNase H-like nuclease (RuvC/YqgF family)
MTLLELIFIWIIPIACLTAAIMFAVGEVRKDEETIKQRNESIENLKEALRNSLHTCNQLRKELHECHKQHFV